LKPSTNSISRFIPNPAQVDNGIGMTGTEQASATDFVLRDFVVTGKNVDEQKIVWVLTAQARRDLFLKDNPATIYSANGVRFSNHNFLLLQIQQNGQDHRAAGGLFIQELGNGIAQALCSRSYNQGRIIETPLL